MKTRTEIFRDGFLCALSAIARGDIEAPCEINIENWERKWGQRTALAEGMSYVIHGSD